jgi:glycosyltransferase involved in cell wall biosynthesis
VNQRGGDLPKITLFGDQALDDISDTAMACALLVALLRSRAKVVFLCHYERLGTALVALALRLFGRRVYVMGCPKIDDRPRNATKEFLKQTFIKLYMGALVGGPATRDYFEFLGLRGKPIAFGYNTVSSARIRELAKQDEPEKQFESRDFVIVARLVPKKNIATALRGYARYLAANPHSKRNLQICGNGPLEGELKDLADNLGVADRVIFHGFLQSEAVAPILHRAVALVLVSIEEQFGNVVPEALSLGIPLILSDVCGARYELLQTGVNGFMVEAQNVEGLAYCMEEIAADEESWEKLRAGALKLAPLGDATRFADGVEKLIA